MTTSVTGPGATMPYITEPYVEVTDADATRLRRWNLAAAALHTVSSVAMLALANDFSISTVLFSIAGPPGTPPSQGVLDTLFDVPLAYGVAAFSILSALFHLLVSAPGTFDRYIDELRHGRNRFRWVEYSLSSTLMILLIALIVGILDINALIAIAVANASMILFGWIMEMVNRPGDNVWWSPFWFGCIAGAAPWIALVVTLVFTSGEGPPSFVYVILVTIFVAFNCFALNQWLQYRAVGRFSDYLFGERVYIALSFIAKSLLAWQIYANVLVG